MSAVTFGAPADGAPDDDESPLDYERPKAYPVTFVAARLAEPPRAAVSVFECLQACLRKVDQDVYMQEKFDGHRQLVCIAADGSVRVLNKNDVGSDFRNDSALEVLRAELANLPRPCVLDAEMVAFDETGQVRSTLVPGVRHGTAAKRKQGTFFFELVLFDIYTETGWLKDAPYSARHEFLTRVFGRSASRTDETRLQQVRHTHVAMNLAVFNRKSTYASVAQACALVVQQSMEGVVFRGASCAFACRMPGSLRRLPAYVAMKVKPMHLSEYMCSLYALGVSRSFRLLCGVPWYPYAFAKAQLVDTGSISSPSDREWFNSRDVKRRPAGKTFGMDPSKPPQFVYVQPLSEPFVVHVVGDYRLEKSYPTNSSKPVFFIKFSTTSRWTSSTADVPRSVEDLQVNFSPKLSPARLRSALRASLRRYGKV